WQHMCHRRAEYLLRFQRIRWIFRATVHSIENGFEFGEIVRREEPSPVVNRGNLVWRGTHDVDLVSFVVDCFMRGRVANQVRTPFADHRLGIGLAAVKPETTEEMRTVTLD